MGCRHSQQAGPFRPATQAPMYGPEELSKYDTADKPFYRMRPEDKRPIQYAEKGLFSKEAFPGTTMLKAIAQARAVHGDSPAMKVERPCPPLNADGTAPPSLPDAQWKTWTYIDYYEESRRVAKSLHAMGAARYEGVTVYGFNSPEWNLSQLGITMAGCLTAGIYPTDAPEAVAFKTKHCRASVAIVEDDAKLRRYEEVIDEIPRLKYIVGYAPEFRTKKTLERKDKTVVEVMPWADFLQVGNAVEDSVLDEIEKSIGPEDVFGLIYTSGTTGNPKAVMLSHDNVMSACQATFDRLKSLGMSGQERNISYLPLSHIAACMLDIVSPLFITAFRPGYQTVYFARPYDLKAGSLFERVRTVKPTMFFGVPRVWEKIVERMEARKRTVKGIKRMVVNRARKVALEHQNNIQIGGSGNIPRMYGRFENKVYGKVKEALGFTEAKHLSSAAAPIERATLEYIGSYDINVNEIYGMSESTGAVTFSMDECHLWGSVGFPYSGVDMAIMRKEGDKWVKVPAAKDLFNLKEEEQGELCFRGRQIMVGYMSCPDLADEEEVRKKNEEAIDAEGWLHSGDKGAKDERNMYKITGRFKELIIGAGGENIAPVPIEDAVKRLGKGVISNAQMVGDKRKYNVMLITLLTKGATGEKPGSDDLVGAALDFVPGVTKVSEAMKNEEFIKKIETMIKDVNADGTVCPSQASRITKFTILPVDFSIETDELTPTLKLKRGFTEKKYAKALDAMYVEGGDVKSTYVPYVA